MIYVNALGASQFTISLFSSLRRNMATPYLTKPIIARIIKAATTLATENVPSTPASFSIIGPIAAAIVTEAIRDPVLRDVFLDKD